MTRRRLLRPPPPREGFILDTWAVIAVAYVVVSIAGMVCEAWGCL